MMFIKVPVLSQRRTLRRDISRKRTLLYAVRPYLSRASGTFSGEVNMDIYVALSPATAGVRAPP